MYCIWYWIGLFHKLIKRAISPNRQNMWHLVFVGISEQECFYCTSELCEWERTSKRSSRGKEFHIRGAAAEKARSPKPFIWVLGKWRWSLEEERVSRPESRILINAVRYNGARPILQRNTSKAILNSIRWQIGSQWRERRALSCFITYLLFINYKMGKEKDLIFVSNRIRITQPIMSRT